MIEKLIRGHSMPNQPASPSNESIPKTAPGTRVIPVLAGSGYGSVSSRRPAADGRPGKLHPADRVAGRGAVDCGRGATRCPPGHAEAVGPARRGHPGHGAQGCAHAQPEPLCFYRGREPGAAGALYPIRAVHGGRGGDAGGHVAGAFAGVRGAGAQRDRPVPADRRGVADALRRTADHRGQHRRACPAGGLCGLFSALPDHGRQAAVAGNGRAWPTGWSN